MVVPLKLAHAPPPAPILPPKMIPRTPPPTPAPTRDSMEREKVKACSSLSVIVSSVLTEPDPNVALMLLSEDKTFSASLKLG